MRILALLAILLLSGCAASPTTPTSGDPFERINRGTYAFNDAVDRTVLKPVAKGYVRVVPSVVRIGVNNFLTNLAYPLTLANDILQLKPKAVGQDLARLFVNTTLGLGGLLDPASTAIGLPLNDEDLGQTLGYWGVPSGPYLVLPFMGPSSLRDAPSSVAQTVGDPRSLFGDSGFQAGTLVLSVLNLRAGLLPVDDLVAKSYDPYSFIRNAWMQRREYRVRDGKVEDSGHEAPLVDPLEDPLEDPADDPELSPQDPPETPQPR